MTEEFSPDPKIIAAMFSALVDIGCTWTSVSFDGIRSVKYRSGHHDSYWATGSSEKEDGKGKAYWAAINPIDSTSIAVVELNEQG